MALDRLTKANEDIVILAAPGLGGSSVLAEVANRALIKGEFPGGVYYTDLAGVETRESAAVALSLALNAPRGVAEKDVDAAVVAALRHIGTERLTLIVFDAAESLVASSATGGEDFCAFVTKLQSVGPQIRFLVGTSHPVRHPLGLAPCARDTACRLPRMPRTPPIPQKRHLAELSQARPVLLPRH